MAQKATIYKVELSVSDMDRHYYETHNLTVAKHPSETDERLMVRILSFALNAHEQLEFSRGISTDDEPDIWQKSLSGELELWVTLGLPSEKIIRQSCSKAKKMIVYCYGGRTAEIWWEKIKTKTTRFRARGHSGFPLGLISDSNFQNGGLNERATVCGIGRLVAAA